MGKFGFPPLFVSFLREFHDGMSARVITDGLESEPFEVLVCVKQGCVLAPVIFNLFLASLTLLTASPGVTVSSLITVLSQKSLHHQCLISRVRMMLPCSATLPPVCTSELVYRVIYMFILRPINSNASSSSELTDFQRDLVVNKYVSLLKCD